MAAKDQQPPSPEGRGGEEGPTRGCQASPRTQRDLASEPSTPVQEIPRGDHEFGSKCEQH